MQLNSDSKHQPIYIKSYNPDQKEILIHRNYNNLENICKYNKSIIISFDKIIEFWGNNQINNYKKLSNTDIQEIINYSPEIIIIGTGDNQVQLDYNVIEPLYKTKIPFEIMSTINACRTYNLLASENRKVTVGLII